MPKWWTVDAPPPEPPPLSAPLMERALSLLLTSLRLRIPSAWKSVQLSVVMLWNAAVQSREMCFGNFRCRSLLLRQRCQLL